MGEKKTPREMGLSKEQLQALEAVHYILPDEPIGEKIVKDALEGTNIA